MENQRSSTFIAGCIGIGVAEVFTEEHRLQLQKDLGWLDRDLLCWYADYVARAIYYAEHIHSILCARRAVGLLSERGNAELIVGVAFGRWYAEMLFRRRGLPDAAACLAAIESIIIPREA